MLLFVMGESMFVVHPTFNTLYQFLSNINYFVYVIHIFLYFKLYLVTKGICKEKLYFNFFQLKIHDSYGNRPRTPSVSG